MSYYRCEIKMNDEDETFVSLIKDNLDIDEATDEQVFYYLQDFSEMELLLNENNGEDFVVLNYIKEEE